MTCKKHSVERFSRSRPAWILSKPCRFLRLSDLFCKLKLKECRYTSESLVALATAHRLFAKCIHTCTVDNLLSPDLKRLRDFRRTGTVGSVCDAYLGFQNPLNPAFANIPSNNISSTVSSGACALASVMVTMLRLQVLCKHSLVTGRTLWAA